jgi:hypothetical protein
MSLSDLSMVDPVDDLPPTVVARLEDAQSSAHTAIALIMGTLVASPVLVAALVGHQDVVVALALYLAAIVVSWIAVGLFAGAFALAGRARRRDDDSIDTASSPRPTPKVTEPEPAESAESVESADATVPDPATSTR